MKHTYIYIVLLFLVFVRCAQITPLTGGKRDNVPPKILESNPPNASLNFTARDIEIRFDEYIVLKDVANQLIITPQTKELPEVEAVGKRVKIRFTETLLPNTTYKLSFGNAIADLRESNSLSNFSYIFSTGNTIDSLTMSGQVINASDKKPASKLLVGLYKADAADSIIYKDKPLYISRTDDAGKFSFDYLPDASFKVVAIQDQNKNLMYDGSEEQLAFLNETVRTRDSTQVAMTLFKEIPVKSFVRKTSSLEYGKAIVIYNKPQKTIKNVSGNGIIATAASRFNDTLTFYYSRVYDTLKPVVNHESGKADSLLIRIPSESNIEKQKKNQVFNYTFQTNFSSTLLYSDIPRLTLNFPISPQDIDQKKMILSEIRDSVKTPLTYSLIAEPGTFNTVYALKAQFKPETNYVLTLDTAAFSDASGRRNNAVTYKFKTTAEEDYAILNLKLLFPKKENYIVLLLNDKEQIVKETLIEIPLTASAEKQLLFKDLLPGNYFIKVVEDANKDGIFNTGDYFLHQQAETIFVNTSPIKLLAGWEVENEWMVK